MIDEVDWLVDFVTARDVQHLETEVLVVVEMPDVLQRARVEIVHAHHPVAARYQVVAQVGAEETGPAGDERSRHQLHTFESGIPIIALPTERKGLRCHGRAAETRLSHCPKGAWQ